MNRRSKLQIVFLALMLVEMIAAVDFVLATPLYMQHPTAATLLLSGSACVSTHLAIHPAKKDRHDFIAVVLAMSLRLLLAGALLSFLVAAFAPHDWRQLCWSVWLATVVFYLFAAILLRFSWQRVNSDNLNQMHPQASSKTSASA